MTKTLTLEGDIAAVDTAVNLTTQGSVTAPSLVIPTGVTKIDKIIAAAAADGAAAGAAVYLLRLDGAGVMNGEQTVVLGGQGTTAVQSGSDQAPGGPSQFELDDVDITIKASEVIKVQGEMMGADIGTASITVTLVFA